MLVFLNAFLVFIVVIISGWLFIRYPGYLFLRWLFDQMARIDLLVTFRTEGEIKAKMKGEDCVGFIARISNHLLDPVDCDVFKAALDNLIPMIDHFWARAEEAGVKGVAFVERKLKEVGLKPGETEGIFLERIKSEYDGQTAVRPKFLNEAGEVQYHSLKWYVLVPEFYRQLKAANEPDWFERTFGVVWIGFPPYRVFKYWFQWLKYALKPAKPGPPSKEFTMTLRRDRVNSIYARYPAYGVDVEKVETGAPKIIKKRKGGGSADEIETVLVDLELVIETVTRNPKKSLFRTAGLSSAGDWLSAITRELRSRVRSWVGTVDYDHLIGKKDLVDLELARICREVNQIAIPNYGQEIVNVSLVSVQLNNPTLQKSIDAVFSAKREQRAAVLQAKRDITLAKGLRALAAAPGLGKADGYKKIAAVEDGAGTRMRQTEAMGEGGIKVFTIGGDGRGNLLGLPESLFDSDGTPASAGGTGTPANPSAPPASSSGSGTSSSGPSSGP